MKQPLAEGPLLLTLTEAARLLGISRTTIHKLVGNGSLPYRRVGADRRIPRAALESFAQSELVQADHPDLTR